jgi:hypothetical protein
MTAAQIFDLQSTLAQTLRNDWSLLEHDTPLRVSVRELGLDDPAEVSLLIIDAFWRKHNNEPVPLKELVRDISRNKFQPAGHPRRRRVSPKYWPGATTGNEDKILAALKKLFGISSVADTPNVGDEMTSLDQTPNHPFPLLRILHSNPHGEHSHLRSRCVE